VSCHHETVIGGSVDAGESQQGIEVDRVVRGVVVGDDMRVRERAGNDSNDHRGGDGSEGRRPSRRDRRREARRDRTGVQTTANETGRYTLTLLPPGTYEVTFTLSGFQSAVVKDIELHVNDRLEVSGKLGVGVTETVQVEATSRFVQSTPAVQNLMGARLPICGSSSAPS
jgi:hypothetical protein